MGQLCSCTRSQKKSFKRNTILPANCKLPGSSPHVRFSSTAPTERFNNVLPYRGDVELSNYSPASTYGGRTASGAADSTTKDAFHVYSRPTEFRNGSVKVDEGRDDENDEQVFLDQNTNGQMPASSPELRAIGPALTSVSDDVSYSDMFGETFVLMQSNTAAVVGRDQVPGEMDARSESIRRQMRNQAQKIKTILQKLVDLLSVEIDPVYIERYFRKTRSAHLPEVDSAEESFVLDTIQPRIQIRDLLWDVITGEEAEDFDVFCDVIGSEGNQRHLVNLLLTLDSVIALVSPEVAEDDLVSDVTSVVGESFVGRCGTCDVVVGSNGDRCSKDFDVGDFNIDLINVFLPGISTSALENGVKQGNNIFSNFANCDASTHSLARSCSPSIIGDDGGDEARVSTPVYSLNLLNYCLCVGQRKARLSQILSEFDCIHDLSLVKNHLDEEGIACLADGLTSNRSITHLDLRLSPLGNDGVRRLAEALKSNTVLRVLNVSSVGMTELGCESLMKGVAQNRSLVELDIGYNDIGDVGCRAVADALVRFCPITKLRMRDNGITCSGASVLFRSLARNSRLTLLDVSSNCLGNESVRHLSEALIHNRTLRELNLENCRLTSAGCTSIARAIRANGVLKILQLSLNPLSDSGIGSLADALRYNHSLEVICLNMCDFGNPGFFRLLQALRYNSSLKTAKMCYNKVGSPSNQHQLLESRDDDDEDHVTPSADEMYNLLRDILHLNPNLKLLLWGNQMMDHGCMAIEHGSRLFDGDYRSQSSADYSLPSSDVIAAV